MSHYIEPLYQSYNYSEPTILSHYTKPTIILSQPYCTEPLHCTKLIQRKLKYISLVQTCCILKTEFQLVGVTAMLIACKYEEIYFPNLSDFITMTDHAYKEEEMRAMEVRILKELDYSLGNPLVIHFLRRFSRIAEVRKVLASRPAGPVPCRAHACHLSL